MLSKFENALAPSCTEVVVVGSCIQNVFRHFILPLKSAGPFWDLPLSAWGCAFAPCDASKCEKCIQGLQAHASLLEGHSFNLRKRVYHELNCAILDF